MRCLSPRKVGFLADGKTISWSPKHYSKEYAPFQLPCGKCIECRLEYARQWAVRCVHEAKMHQDNSFITLTYKELNNPKLQYEDFQKFMKRLRKYYTINEQTKISAFVTGEYGEKTKRPHWHAIIFNWQPKDLIYQYSNENKDKIYTSKTLDQLWTHGNTQVGSVTFKSAGYCARYAAKKLVHGPDGHEYEPISKKSSKNAIGKKFLESYWQDIFNYGHIILEDGVKTSIPRYYEKWLQKQHPTSWIKYITEIKYPKIQKTINDNQKENQQTIKITEKRIANGNYLPLTTKQEARKKIITKKFNELQKHLKGDI